MFFSLKNKFLIIFIIAFSFFYKISFTARAAGWGGNVCCCSGASVPCYGTLADYYGNCESGKCSSNSGSGCKETAPPACPSGSYTDASKFNNNAFRFTVQNCAGSRYCYSASSVDGSKGNPSVDCTEGKLKNLCKGDSVSAGTTISCDTDTGKTISATCPGTNDGNPTFITEKIGFCLEGGTCQYKSESECSGPIYMNKRDCEKNIETAENKDSHCCCLNAKCTTYNESSCLNGSWISQTSCKPDEENGCNSEYPYQSESVARNTNGKCQYSALYDSKTKCWRRGNSSNGNTASCTGNYYSSSFLASNGGIYNAIAKTVANICQNGTITCYLREIKAENICERKGFYSHKISKSEEDEFCKKNFGQHSSAFNVYDNICFMCEKEESSPTTGGICGSGVVKLGCQAGTAQAIPGTNNTAWYCVKDGISSSQCNYTDTSSCTPSCTSGSTYIMGLGAWVDCLKQTGNYLSNNYITHMETSCGESIKCYSCKETSQTNCQTEGGITYSGSEQEAAKACVGRGLYLERTWIAQNGDKCYSCKKTSQTNCQTEGGITYSGSEQEAAKACVGRGLYLERTWTAQNGDKCYSCKKTSQTNCQSEGGYTSSGSVTNDRQECINAGLTYSGSFTAQNGDKCYKCKCNKTCVSGHFFDQAIWGSRALAQAYCLLTTGSNVYDVHIEDSCDGKIACYTCRKNTPTCGVGTLAAYPVIYTSDGQAETYCQNQYGSDAFTQDPSGKCFKCDKSGTPTPTPTPTPPGPNDGDDDDGTGGDTETSCLNTNGVPTQSIYNAVSLSSSETWGNDTTNSLALRGPGKTFIASDGRTYYLINGKKDANGNICSFEKDSSGNYKKNSNGDYIYASDNKCTTNLCYAHCKYSVVTCTNTSCPSGSTCTTTNYSEVVNNQCVNKVCYTVTSSN